MEMIGEHQIPAKRHEVWKALNNPDILKECIPGCTELESINAQHLKATVALKVGPVSAKFKGEVELSDIIEPISYRISGEGKGGVAGFAKGGASVILEENADSTVLRYNVDVKIDGKFDTISIQQDWGSKYLYIQYDNIIKIRNADEFMIQLKHYGGTRHYKFNLSGIPC